MSGAKSQILKFMDIFTEVFNKTVKDHTGKSYNISPTLMRNVFFKNMYHENKNENFKGTTIDKLDNIEYFLNENHIKSLILNLLKKDCETDEKDIFENILEKFGDSKKIDETYLFDTLPFLGDFINNLTDRFPHFPYIWTEFKKNLERVCQPKDETENSKLDVYCYYKSAICYYILALMTYSGLRYNKIKTPEKFIPVSLRKFKKTLSSCDRILFCGDYGKTTFLENFASKNRETVFYFDAKNEPVELLKVFLALRPDCEFWMDVDWFDEISSKYNNLIIPLIDDEYEEYLRYTPKDDVLIIDHIPKENTDIVAKLKKWPCKIIFVFEDDDKISIDGLSKYEYNNREVLIKTLISGCAKGKYIKNHVFKKIYSDLGNDCVLYKIIKTAHEEFAANSKGFDFIQRLYDVKNIDDYEKIFLDDHNNNLSKISFSIDYCGRSKREKTGLYIGAHIVNIYDDYFEDIEKLSKPDKDRSNAWRLHILRFLCRIKQEEISYTKIKNFLELIDTADDNIFTKIEKLGWIKADKICIPDIVAYAFNRKESLNYEQYAEELLFRNSFTEYIMYKSAPPIDKSLMLALLNVFLDDIPYLKQRAESIDTEYKNVVINHKISKKRERLTSILSKHGQRTTPIKSDKSLQTVALHKESMLLFLETAFMFSMRYREYVLCDKIKDVIFKEDTYGRIIGLIWVLIHKETNCKYDVKLVSLDFNDTYFHVNGSIFILFMEYYCNYFADVTLHFLENADTTKSKNIFNNLRAGYLCRLNKAISDFDFVVSHFEKHFLDAKNSIPEFLVTYKSIRHIYLDIWRYIQNMYIDNLFDILYMKLNSNELNTRIYENYIAFQCVLIMSNKNKNIVDRDFKGIASKFLGIKDDFEDLPFNISKMVQLAEQFLLENNQFS